MHKTQVNLSPYLTASHQIMTYQPYVLTLILLIATQKVSPFVLQPSSSRHYTTTYPTKLSALLDNEVKSPIIGSKTHITDDYESPADESGVLGSLFPEISNIKNDVLNPIIIVPMLMPILAYYTYDDVARLFNTFVDLLNVKRNWVPVDGGAYQAKIIAPAINGIVVPTISILFATLISNTVATLRQRQIDIHTSLNTEAGDLRVLSSLVDAFPKSQEMEKCRLYLTQYTSRLIAESRDDVNFKSIESEGSTDSELNGFISVLNELAKKGDDHSPRGPILSESYGAVVRLNSKRSARITSLQAAFPELHYAILATLAGSICFAFLMETNQELLMFLNAIQLRILWTMLIGTLSALAVVCYDLSGPFRGQYQISNAVEQLMTIRDALKAGTSKK